MTEQTTDTPVRVTTTIERCEMCRFFYFDEVRGYAGGCHRHAPRPVVAKTEDAPGIWWPVVAYDDWCGEFVPDRQS